MSTNDNKTFAAAIAAQAIGGAQALALGDDTLPCPPAGLPALQSVPGRGMGGALVLGYIVVEEDVRDCIGPDGKHKVPGDKGFLQAQYGRLGVAPMPRGWRFETRLATVLYALVNGNPILLETPARRLGYVRAIAAGPSSLCLGEIDL